jgi:hypothetical protein
MPLDLAPHVGADLGVQAGGGLVEEEHAGPVHERHGDVQAPLHPARVRAPDAVGGLGQAEAVQQLVDPLLERAAAHAVDLTL